MKFGRILILFLLLALFEWSRISAAVIILDNENSTVFSSRIQADGGVVILMYHGLDEEFGQDPAKFEQQMQYLADNHFNTITLDHLRDWIVTGEPELPPRPVVLTFDDNYITIYTVAFPVLQSHGFIGYNFTHTHYVGVLTSYDHADWDEINEMEDAGVIFTESHTIMHYNLPSLSSTVLLQELEGSKAAIEANIPGKVCRHLAYPYGGYNANVISVALSVGYETAVTTISGLNTRQTPLMELRRFGVDPNTPMNTFTGIVNQVSGVGGEWTASTSQPGYIGSHYQYATAGYGESVATWLFIPPVSGSYQVSVRYTDHSNRASNAPYLIKHRDGETTVRVNQRTAGGTWFPVGEYYYEAGKSYTVRLTNEANGFVIADAIQFELVELPVSHWEIY